MLIIPDHDELSLLNPIENNNLDFRKIIKTLFLPISIVVFIFILALLIISYFDKNQKENYISNEIKQIFLLSNFFESSLYKRTLLSKQKEYKNEEEKVFKNEFIHNLSYINYEGKWNNKKFLNSNGSIYLQLSTNRNIFPDNLNLIIRLTQGSYIDNWIAFYNEIPIKNVKINETNLFNNNFILFEGEYESQIEIGEVFERKKLYSKCKSYILLNLTKNENINYKNNIQGTLRAKCNNELEYDITLNIKIKNSEIEKQNVNFYSLLTIIICLLMAFNTSIIQYKLKDSEGFANGISLLTIYENIIWNSYGCLCHFFLTLNYPNYLHQFVFPTITFFINFSITDLQFLYFIWRIKYQNELTDPIIVRKKLIRLYFMFYLGMFFSLFFVTKFFFDKSFIILGILLTWSPQILFNIYYNNRVALPWSYIIFISIYRLFIPCYFRINRNNFFLISPDYPFSIFIIFLMLAQIYILYYQSIKGSRYFLPEKYKKRKFEFYKNKEEIMNLNSNANNIECVICLNPLFNEENENEPNMKLFLNDFITLDQNEHVQILKDNFNNYDKKTNWKDKFTSLFEFSERSLNFEKKKYIITPCKHYFHSKCLEMWFQRKRECPNCRTIINMNF